MFFFITAHPALHVNGQEAGSSEFSKVFNVPKGTVSAMDFNTPPRVVSHENKGWLGIFMSIPGKSLEELGAGPGEKGAQVDHVIEDSPAYKGGLKEGDIIVSIDGKPLQPIEGESLLETFKNKIQDLGGGAQTELIILRKKERLTLKIKLGSPLKAQPVLKERPDLEKKERHPSVLEKAIEKAGLGADVEKVLDSIREVSYEIGSYQLLFKDRRKNPFRLEVIDYLLHFPMRSEALATELSGNMQKRLRARDISGLVRIALEKIDVQVKNPEKKDGVELRDFIEYVEEWKAELVKANEKRRDAFSELTDLEIEFLFDSAPHVLKQDSKQTRKEPSWEEISQADSRQLKFLRLAAKIDYEKLFGSFTGLLNLIDFNYYDYLNGLDDRIRELTDNLKPKQARPGVEGLVLLDEEFELGRIIVGGPGRNIYSGDAALIIDLGGDDIYLNSAGGSRKDIPVSICIDLAGNDTYRGQDAFSQAGGRMGMGILIDMDGDDIYEGSDYSQGIGFFGLGLLYDEKGDDSYMGKTANQGAGFFGCGLLLDSHGDDSYSSQLYSQGFGMVKGIGAIVNGTGNDRYFAGKAYPDSREPGKAYQSLSQGYAMGLRPFKSTVGASGGIGLLSDGQGNDSYNAEYFSQGASYWYALGILADEEGHDTYYSRRYSQGAGVHRSIGVLWDRNGDDQYTASFGVSQGCGHDKAIGMLIDSKGNDSYLAGIYGQGAGNAGGLGILLDKNGKDLYYNNGSSQGWGSQVDKEEDSFGVLMDLGGGQDRYMGAGKNNSVSVREKWGLLIDASSLDVSD